MDDEFFNKLVKLLLSMDKKIDEIHKKVVPIMEDVSKHLAEAKELANKGKKPRKQPKKKEFRCGTKDCIFNDKNGYCKEHRQVGHCPYTRKR